MLGYIYEYHIPRALLIPLNLRFVLSTTAKLQVQAPGSGRSLLIAHSLGLARRPVGADRK